MLTHWFGYLHHHCCVLVVCTRKDIEMKLAIEESVLRQALEALCYMWNEDEIHPDTKERITALKSALDDAEKVEPVAEVSDWDINSMDAAVLAKAFADRFTVWSQAHGVESDTFGLMVGWFANAIMAGYDEAVRRHPAPAVPEVESLRQQIDLINADLMIANEAAKESWDQAKALEQQLAECERERDELVAAIETTLDENGHLADGDNCTLIALKRALAKLGAEKTGEV